MRVSLGAFLVFSFAAIVCAQPSARAARGQYSRVAPFTVIENIHYVGTSNAGAFLVTTSEGHVLIDSGYPGTAEWLREDIERLGFRVGDIKYLLNTHAHSDHVGGHAQFRQWTGARTLVSAADAPVLIDGGRSDFRSDGREQWTPVTPDGLVRDGDEVRIGGTTLTAHLTPGHTKGNTTWTTRIGHGGRTLDVVFVGSMGLSAGVPLVGNERYPQIADDYARSFALLRTLPSDVFLAFHADHFDMPARRERLEKGGGPNPFVDGTALPTYVAKNEEAYLAELAKEKATPPGAAPFRLEDATIAGIRAAFDAGALSCQELATMYLARIAAYEDGGPKLNAITTVNPALRDTAVALDAERRARGPRGPLHCIPVLLKDNIDTADMPTSNGSVILAGARPPDDAFIAKSLRDAGALVLGKAAMGEFAGGSYNTIDGQVTNPYNFKRDTGGSSAGSAAAVSANLSVLAVGTDTSTSVRGPSAFTGIVGLRPTTGLVSRDGIAPKNLTFDTAGPMARTVSDVAALLNVLAGPDRADPLSVETFDRAPAGVKDREARRYVDFTSFLERGALKGARLGVLRDFFGGDPAIDALATAALARLEALGATLVDVRLDRDFLDFYVRKGNANIRRIADYRFRADFEAYLATLGGPVPRTVAEFVRIYETTVAKSPLPVEDSVMDLLKRSLVTSTDAPAYQRLVATLLPEATRAKLAVFDRDRLDALVFPYQPAFAAPIANPARTVDDPTHVAAPDQPNPSIFAGYSSVGFPGIVVPMGFGPQGLPMALSFMGRPYDEGRLLGFAFDFEQATRHRRPSSLLPPVAGESREEAPARPPRR